MGSGEVISHGSRCIVKERGNGVEVVNIEHQQQLTIVCSLGVGTMLLISQRWHNAGEPRILTDRRWTILDTVRYAFYTDPIVSILSALFYPTLRTHFIWPNGSTVLK